VNDLHATLLHLPGFDHMKRAVKFQWLNLRLAGVAGNVTEGILA
jgi:hypothetical protein